MISVIMPTYNRADAIQRAIESVINQTYRDYELLIIDDGSTDGTEIRVRKMDDKRIRYFRYCKNRGANYARNYGMKHAEGEFVAFLDSDNIWKENFLECRMTEMERHRVDFVFGRIEVKSKEGKNYTWPEDAQETLNDEDKLIHRMFLENTVDTNSVCMKYKCFQEMGGFDENLQRLQDWEYFSRILGSRRYKYYFSDDVLVKNYIGADSISANCSYWEARLYIIEKHMNRCRKEKCVETLICHLFSKQEELEIPDEEAKRILKSLGKQEEIKLVKWLAREKAEMEGRLAWQEKSVQELLGIIRKNEEIIEIQNCWIKLKQHGWKMETYLKKIGVRSIAIYGYGVLGHLLYTELKDTGIIINGIVDKSFGKETLKGHKIEQFNHIGQMEKLPNTDAVIVTTVYCFNEIYQELRNHTAIPILSIADIIREDD